MTFLPQELIRKKRDGAALTDEELRWYLAGATSGDIPDYQVAAMLMAIYFQGMVPEELATWANAMVHSGDVLDLSRIDRPKVDKHSTGGVGDKISLPLAPAVAACGVAVPMISGRGLGHTGGTLDKLESIPGFHVGLTVDEFVDQVQRLGAAIIGQTVRLAPADRILYALRDVTGTVESVPLIASSIMSKKLAEGIDGLVLDCKVGEGAFMSDLTQAKELAAAIRTIGRAANTNVSVLFTQMDHPIGRCIGNAMEVEESILTLRGEGPRDTRELTVHLGAEMLLLGGVATSGSEAGAMIETALDSGTALEAFRNIIEAQGGDCRVVDNPTSVLPQAPHHTPVLSQHSGYVCGIDARALGIAAVMLGAGRRSKEENIDPAVGIYLDRTVGAEVTRGEPLLRLAHRDGDVTEVAHMVQNAYRIEPEPPDTPSRILEVLR